MAKDGQIFPVVGIGASAGGLEAFSQLLKHLPADTGMAFVLVQHLDPVRESALPEILSRATPLPVKQVADDEPIAPNHIYVIPPGAGLALADGVLKLQPRKGAGPHHAIDAFFESLAEARRERAVGVVLSGTATDGTLGLEAIKAEGGITFAQDETAKYDSMPQSAIAAGCVDFVLKPEDIAQELSRIAKHPYIDGRSKESFTLAEDDRASATKHEDDATPLPSGGSGAPRTRARKAHGEADAREQPSDGGYRKILHLLRAHCGVDFSLYKSNTIQRRIQRRMILTKHESLEDYAQFLKGNPKELDALYSDVLISVTSFFRNPEAFDVLRQKVFPRIIQQRGDEPVRVWTLGCSTGQEAYSIAIAFVEAAEKASRLRNLQVFATDLNEALLDKARHGLYAKTLAQDVAPERLKQFFVEEEGGFRIVKSLREMVVFARQNFITDPPFSRMDLVSCRNLLIYLEPSLQQKLLPTFHYALKPQGYLFLGASESIGGFTELFEPVDKKQKIYAKKSAPTPAFHLPIRKDRAAHIADAKAEIASRRRGDGAEHERLPAELNSQREADRVAINRYAPPSVLVNADLQVLQFRGPTSAYLEPPTGKASFDILKMAREGLMLPLRAAIDEAQKGGKPVRREKVRVKQNGDARDVNLEVIPLKNLRERCFLIVFEDAEQARAGAAVKDETAAPAKTDVAARKDEKRDDSGRVAALEREIAELRDYLQSVLEQHDAANEELQSANEEVQSANEELQSINEELETSKEELESANEELTTVNEEMSTRNTELARANSDLLNLQASTKLPIVLLGRDLSIRRFSPQAEKLFNLLGADIGRSMSRVRHNLDIADLEPFVEKVIDDVREAVREVKDREGRWYSLRVRPYLTVDNRVDGAVLVLVDIDDMKRKAQEIEAARDYAEAVVRTSRDAVLVLRPDLTVNTANESFYKKFKVSPEETEGRLVFDIGGGAWRILKLRVLLEEILPRNSYFNDFEVTHDFPRLGRRTMLLNARRLQGGAAPMILLAIEDITERQRADVAIASLAAIVDSADDAIVGKDLNGVITTWNKGAERLFGYTAKEAVGKSITMLIPPGRTREETEILARIRRGESLEHFDTVRIRKDGSEVEVSLTISPVKNASGQIIGASKIARDNTERQESRKHRQVLVNELNHRVKNMLSVVMALADQTHRSAGPDSFMKVFGDRLRAMARSVEVLSSESWEGAELTEIVGKAVGPFGVKPQQFDGQAVRLTARQAMSLGMALHELATNATKYGALSNADGKLRLAWKQNNGLVILSWLERGGPPAAAPPRFNFGLRLIQNEVSNGLSGDVDFDFHPEGLQVEIVFPAARGA